MPTYEYACSSCQNEWEAEQSIKDNALTECPRCHQQTARRQISRGTGFILKGGGWYSDLYSSPSNKSSSSAGDAAKPASETKPSTDKGGSGSSGGSSESGGSSSSGTTSGGSGASASAA